MFALFVAVALAQDTITCDAADGSGLHYAEWHKSGGAYPAQDTAMSTGAWTIGAAALFQSTVTYGPSDPPRARIDWEWLADRTVVTGVSGNSMSGSTRYTTAVRLFANDGKAIGGGLDTSEVTVAMACERVDVCCIP